MSVQSGDGRFGAVTCLECDVEPKIGMDPLDDTLVLVCPECEDLVLIADVLKGRVNIKTAVESLEDMDPRLREPVREALEEQDGGED